MRTISPNPTLRRLREESGLTIWMLAVVSGVAASTISAAEKIGYKPGQGARSRLAAALGVTPESIWPECATKEEERQ